MRKVVSYVLTSLDGAVDDPAAYFSAGERPNQPPLFDAVMDEHEARIIGAQDDVLLGRGMYDEWVGYWPKVRDHSFADFINGVRKHVVTSSPLTGHWDNAAAVGGPIEEVVRDLTSRPGGDIGVHGSIALLHSLLAADLIDELQLVIGPAAGFPGRRLFADPGFHRRLELRAATSSPTGSLLVTYAIARTAR